MKNLSRKFVAAVLTTVFAATQTGFAAVNPGLNSGVNSVVGGVGQTATMLDPTGGMTVVDVIGPGVLPGGNGTNTTTATTNLDTGLGAGLGGAVINNVTGGWSGMTTGTGYADLNFNGNSWVQWDALNLNSGETLNFNAVNGANGLTILNTVEGGMSQIYGNINANDGIAHLIISNPNGMLFDGAHFTTAGDVMVTTNPVDASFTNDGKLTVKLSELNPQSNHDNAIYTKEIKIIDSDFSVGGEYSIVSANILAQNSKFNVGNGLKLYTVNGQDYGARTQMKEDANGNQYPVTERYIKLDNCDVIGDVEITQRGNGHVSIVNGGNYDGNLKITTDDSASLNLINTNGKKIHVTGDVEIDASGAFAYVNYSNIDGNLSVHNNAGNIMVKNSKIGKDMNLTMESTDADRTRLQKTEDGKTTAKVDRAILMDNLEVGGNVEVKQTGNGIVQINNGGNYKGNVSITTDDSVALNYVNPNNKKLHIAGNLDVNANGVMTYLRTADVDGNVNMKNGGGFLEVKDVNVGKDMNLTTTAESENADGYKHFVHVDGFNTVGGNATINSKNNIHIGNYNYEQQQLLDGSFTVGGDLTAHAEDGHVMVTVDTTAGNKMTLISDNLNVLSDDEALLTAKEYQFSSKGYIGGIGDYTDENGKTYSKTTQIIDLMENYRFIPNDIKSHQYMNIAGGEITRLDATNAYIASKGDLKVTGVNANNVNLTADRAKIEITGPNVHANNINVGPETDYLKLDFEGRDFTTNYTNIRDGKVITIRPDEVITYELADGGYNQPTLKPSENTTYLVGPEKDIPDPPTPPEPPTPPTPDEPTILPDGNDNAKLLRNVFEDRISEAPVNTPVAFAADLDDDDDGTPIRKNVDGSVTVVRAVPIM